MSIKEENLIQYSGTIKAGQRLVKVGNTFMPVGVGGAFEPGKGGGTVSSSMKFYKCASVDTANKTWSGYELVYDSGGFYTVSEILKDDLTYTKMTPVVDCIYDSNATMKIERYTKDSSKIPTDGLVFYASLNGETPDVAETGQTFTLKKADESNFNWTYMIEDGIPCVSSADADGSDARAWSGLEFDASTLPMGSSSRTVSLWVKIYKTNGTPFFSYGNYSRGNTIQLYYYSSANVIAFSCHGDDVYSTPGYNANQWHHIAVTLNGTTNTTLKFYVDGVPQETIATTEIEINTSGSRGKIGFGSGGSNGRFDGWLSSIRVYDRALNDEEIEALTNEFTPTGD